MKSANKSRFIAVVTPTFVGRRLYLLSIFCAISAAAVQLLVFPVALSPRHFGIVILSLSVLQAVQQFGDLGFASTAARLNLPPETRSWLREIALTTTWVIGGVGGLFLFIAMSSGKLDYTLGVSLLLAVITGILLASSRVRANQRHQEGNERSALFENLIWQNSPKIGMFAGLFAQSSPIVMGAGVLSAALFARPKLPKIFPSVSDLRSVVNIWIPSLVLVVASFLLSWTDSYVLSALNGPEAVGAYQAVNRPLLGIIYFYAPVMSLIQASLNKGDQRRANKLVRLTVWGSLLVIVATGTVLVLFGELIWPMYSFPIRLVSILCIAAWMSSLSATYGTIILVQGQHLTGAIANAIATVAIVITSFALVGPFGIYGAAIASAVGWSVAAIVQGAFVKYVYKIGKGS